MFGKNSNDCLDLVFKRNSIRGKYSKFTKEHQALMRKLFEENYYPSKNDYDTLAKEINEPVDKIINWFKHERRKYLNTGTIETYKKRKIFTKEEESILEKSFKENPRPPAKKYTELSHVIKCSRRQIRKWFSYRRIKLEQIRDKTKVIITKSKAIKKKNLGMNLRRKRHQKNKISLKKNERKKPLSCFLKIKKKTGRIPKKILEDNKKITIKSEEPSSETPKKPSNINIGQSNPPTHPFTSNNNQFSGNSSFQFLFNFFQPTQQFPNFPSFFKPNYMMIPPINSMNPMNPYGNYDYFSTKFPPMMTPPQLNNPAYIQQQLYSQMNNNGIHMRNAFNDPLMMNYLKNERMMNNNILQNHVNFLQNLSNYQTQNIRKNEENAVPKFNFLGLKK